MDMSCHHVYSLALSWSVPAGFPIITGVKISLLHDMDNISLCLNSSVMRKVNNVFFQVNMHIIGSRDKCSSTCVV